MDRIAIVGVSLHATDVTGLAEVRRPPPDRAGAFLRELADVLGASELVVIATCHRVEVVYAREEGPPPDAHDVLVLGRHLAPDDGAAARLAGLLVQRTAHDAVRHLFRVAASLDSLVVGEDQILAQVREAFAVSEDLGLVGPLLRPLFVHAVQVGKRVRSETDLARHPVSVVNLAVTALSDGALHGQVPVVGVVGAGAMGRLLVRALSAADMAPAVVANRTPERARIAAAECGARACSLDELRAGRHPVDALVTATSCADLVLARDDLLRLAAHTPSGRPLLAIDLSVPRNLPLMDEPRCRVIDLDALRGVADRHRALRAEAALSAERLVDGKVSVFTRHHREAEASAVVSDVRAASEEILRKELDALLAGRLAHLPEPDRQILQRWTQLTFGRLMHQPIAALKQLASELAALRASSASAGEERLS